MILKQKDKRIRLAALAAALFLGFQAEPASVFAEKAAETNETAEAGEAAETNETAEEGYLLIDIHPCNLVSAAVKNASKCGDWKKLNIFQGNVRPQNCLFAL